MRSQALLSATICTLFSACVAGPKAIDAPTYDVDAIPSLWKGQVGPRGGSVALRLPLDPGLGYKGLTFRLNYPHASDGRPHFLMLSGDPMGQNDPETHLELEMHWFDFQERLPTGGTPGFASLPKGSQGIKVWMAADIGFEVEFDLQLSHDSRQIDKANRVAMASSSNFTFTRVDPSVGPLRDSPANSFDLKMPHLTEGIEGFLLAHFSPIPAGAAWPQWRFTFSDGHVKAPFSGPGAASGIGNFPDSRGYPSTLGSFPMSYCQPKGEAKLEAKNVDAGGSVHAYYFYGDNLLQSLGAVCPPP